MSQNIMYDLHEFVYQRPHLVELLKKCSDVFTENHFKELDDLIEQHLEVVYIFLFSLVVSKYMFSDLTDPLLGMVCIYSTELIISRFENNENIYMQELQYRISEKYKSVKPLQIDISLATTPIISKLLDESFVSRLYQYYKLNDNKIDNAVYKVKKFVKNGAKNSIKTVKESNVIRNNIGWIFVGILIILLLIFAD